MDFEVVTDYGVSGGRLDLVWSWVPPAPVPGLVAPVAVVGFEIESGWNSRKHVKGDLLNLRDADVALAVIVLAGVDPTAPWARPTTASPCPPTSRSAPTAPTT